MRFRRKLEEGTPEVRLQAVHGVPCAVVLTLIRLVRETDDVFGLLQYKNLLLFLDVFPYNLFHHRKHI